MKTIKEIKYGGGNQVLIFFEDGAKFEHTVTSQEMVEIQKGDRRYIEYIIAKYHYRDRRAVVGVWRYVNDGKICALPCGFSCGQCKFFEPTHYSYSEVFMGCPDPNSWPYPVGTCKKHGFGPALSADRNADGKGCGWEMADWCKLDDRKLSVEEERRLREIFK